MYLSAFIFLAFGTVMAVQLTRLWRAQASNLIGKLGIGIMAIGTFGFAEPVWINLIPASFLDQFELPNTLAAPRFTTPDGHVLIVSSPIARVQRYGPEGFEKGFTYRRKAFRFGVSASGNLLICDGDDLLTYTADGAEVPPRGSCKNGFSTSTWPETYPSQADLSKISQAKVPKVALNWFSALAVPLWHPMAALIVYIVGGLLLKLSSVRWLVPFGTGAGRKPV